MMRTNRSELSLTRASSELAFASVRGRGFVRRSVARTGLGVGALALGAAFASEARGNEVVDWSERAARLVAEQTPMEQSRVFAIVQLAVHDALNAVEPRYEAYAFAGEAKGASPEAAVATAAHDTLVALVPDRAAEIEGWYLEALAVLPESKARARGIQVGQHAAERLIALRADDVVAGALTAPYTEGTQIGEYRSTPPFEGVVVGARWGEITPFVMPHPAAFRPARPPRVDGRRYARDYAEVARIGVAEGSTRTPEQTEIADFWYESSSTGWLRIAGAVARERNLDLWDSARTLGLVGVALADGFVNGFDAKYHYDYWRPITAIRAGDADGNRRTEGDPEWTPYCETPPVPDYPSTHSLLGAAAASVLAHALGDATAFTADSLSLPGVTRSFERFSQAARENAESRVYCGIHWRSAIEAGLEQGYRMGHYIFERALEPVRRRPR